MRTEIRSDDLPSTAGEAIVVGSIGCAVIWIALAVLGFVVGFAVYGFIQLFS